MKRIMTLIGAIIGLVFQAIYSVIMLIGIAAIFELIAAGGGGGGMLVGVVGLLEIGLGLAALILNATCIGAFSWSHEKYIQKRGKIITAIVFNVLLALLMMLALSSILPILVLIASLAAAILYIVDMCLEGKRAAAITPAEAPATEETKSDDTQA